ncbi:MAG: ribosomal protein S18 acetylase RimI-like enzyme [Patiriisocius sp.]|jgi:ribosomal protein S18 acetylase RimI-like enzyme
MEIRLSEPRDIQHIMNIIHFAQRHLKSFNIDQWQDGYPDEAQILDDIKKDESFVVLDKDNKMLATFMLTTNGEPTYNTIEGEWITDNKTQFGVIHRIAVAENTINKGMAQDIIRHCEGMLKSQTITTMRIDTHQDNKGMQHILKKLQYVYCGIITLNSGDIRFAYEKLMS